MLRRVRGDKPAATAQWWESLKTSVLHEPDDNVP
jgi:hypothetical protein